MREHLPRPDHPVGIDRREYRPGHLTTGILPVTAPEAPHSRSFPRFRNQGGKDQHDVQHSLAPIAERTGRKRPIADIDRTTVSEAMRKLVKQQLVEKPE
jgi:hypothetical protein